MLSVRNGARAAELYKSAVVAIEVYRVEDPSGSVVSHLSVAGAGFWVSDEAPEHSNFSPEILGGGATRMILTVSKPDVVLAKARGAGADDIFVVDEAYRWRLGRSLDLFGHHRVAGRPFAS